MNIEFRRKIWIGDDRFGSRKLIVGVVKVR